MSSPLPPDAAAYLADSYPHNHSYRIRGGKLKPGWQLWRRWRRIHKLYAPGGNSLLDLASCKGFFVFDAVVRADMQRVRGIDVHQPDLDASRAAATHLGLEGRLQLDRLHMHQLAAEIDAGDEQPFDTTLLINTYHYLFFGSRREEHHYPTHTEIFALLANATATGGRLIFSNRVEIERCPRHIQERAQQMGRAGDYDEAQIRAAIEPHFSIEPRGKLGKIPLWILHRS